MRKKIVLILIILLVGIGIYFFSVLPTLENPENLPLDINVSNKLENQEVEKLFAKYGLVQINEHPPYEFRLLTAHINTKEDDEQMAIEIKEALEATLGEQIYSFKVFRTLSDKKYESVWRVNVRFNRGVQQSLIEKEVQTLFERENAGSYVSKVAYYDTPMRYLVRDEKKIGCKRLVQDQNIEDCGVIVPD